MPEKVNYKIIEEAGEKVLQIDYHGLPYIPSLEDDAATMARVFNILLKTGPVQKIVFLQKEEYVYDFRQVKLLLEIVTIYNELVNNRNVFDFRKFKNSVCTRFWPAWQEFLRTTILQTLKEDPIGAYVALTRRMREEWIKQERPPVPEYADCVVSFGELLDSIIALLRGTELIKLAEPFLEGYKIGDRKIYTKFLRPFVRPFFMYTRLVTRFPTGAEELKSYKVIEDTDVLILKVPKDIRKHYYIIPPEFKLTEEKYELLSAAREVMAEHRPQRSEFIDPDRTREIFYSIEKDLLSDLAKSKNIKLDYAELEELARILLRYTIGFGLVEILLSDPKIQDIVVNAPIGVSPISIIHADYGECRTNITPMPNEGESWATKLRLISGRPLDEANPVLDASLRVPGGRARVAAMQRPLSPSGLAFAFRRHRDRTWTFPLFIENKMISPLAAGVLSFLADGGRTILIAGTRSAGKTSLLGALMTEIMRTNRIITIEDSVTGDCRILLKRNGTFKKTTVGELVDGIIAKYNSQKRFGRDVVKGIPEDIEVFAIDQQGKQKLSKVSAFIRHKVSKDIYAIKTSTGRQIKVTGDHSLFGIGEKGVLKEIKVKDLKIGDYIAVPRVLSIANKPKERINLLEYVNKLDKVYAIGEQIRGHIIKNWLKIKELAKQHNYNKSAPSAWKRNSILPVKILSKLPNLKLNHSKVKLKAKASSRAIPAELRLDEDFLTFIGLWLADGCYDKNSVIISTGEKEEKEIVYKVGKKLNLPVKRHSDGFALMLNSKVLKLVMQDVLELKGNAFTKKIPGWVYNLSKKQIAAVLRGIFSGDGCAGDKEVVISLVSEQLLHDIQTLLLSFGIVLRKSNKKNKDNTYNSRISALKFLKVFEKHINFLQQRKKDKLRQLCSRISTHDSLDIIPLSFEAKLELSTICKGFNKNDYLQRGNAIGREHLKSLITDLPRDQIPNPLSFLADSDILWDKIVDIKKCKKKHQYIYDLSVPGYENFICENILAHNTLELPVKQLRDLGYDIQSMKVRSVITGAKAEVPAEQGVRTSLRLGDSALIVGEVRSKEALALWEAMRVGALAKTVAGTIHGESPYGVFDRVVNDLGVPRTSFKATDIIVVANPITSPSGLEQWRRVVQVAEVRKFWEEDPLREKGFANLFEYSSKKDELVPTDVLTEGESEIIKAIGGRVKEWAGNWPAIWENIQLRAKLKQAIVDAAKTTGNRELMEAPFVVMANDQFHKISSFVAEEVGYTDAKRVYSEWSDWLKKAVKKVRSME